MYTHKDTFLHNLSNHPKEYNLSACLGWTKIMETAVKDTHVFIDMPVIQLVSFLKQTQVSSE